MELPFQRFAPQKKYTSGKCSHSLLAQKRFNILFFEEKYCKNQSHLPGCGAWAGVRGPMLRRPHTWFNALLALVVFKQRSSFSHLALGPENHAASTGDNQHARALKTFPQKASFLMERKREIRKYHNCFRLLL